MKANGKTVKEILENLPIDKAEDGIGKTSHPKDFPSRRDGILIKYYTC